MATGPEHYREAERLLEEFGQEVEVPVEDRAFMIAYLSAGMARAQVHATLALAAATALGHLLEGGPLGADRYAWICAASEHPGQQRRISEANAEFEEAQR